MSRVLQGESYRNTNFMALMLVYYCITRLCFVMTEAITYFNLLLVFLLGAFVVFLCLVTNSQFNSHFLQSNIVFLLILIGTIFIQKQFIVNDDYLSIAELYLKQLLVLLIIWGIYAFMNCATRKTRHNLIKWYLFGIIISAAYTFYVALTSSQQYVIRKTAFGVYDSSFRFTYGGFDFIYGAVIIYVCLVTLLHKKWKEMRLLSRAVLIAISVLLALMIIVSGYSTAFALIFVFTVLELLPKGFGKILFLVVLVVILFVFPNIITGLIRKIPFIPNITSYRINEMILSLSGRLDSCYFTESGQRLDRILWSLKVFAEHPLIGGFAGNTKLSFGYHTEWIEQLARYGLIAFIFFFVFFAKSYKSMLSKIQKDDVNYYSLRNAFVVFIVLGFLNPISMVVTAAPVFVLAPFVEDVNKSF